jgi:Reverse transcriptase (RNA-dependent DNA polymerase)
VVDLVAPFLCELYNRSLSTATVPAAFKSAFVTPLLKKPHLNNADVRSYRPISNVLIVSKLLERVVHRRMSDLLKLHDLLPRLQSAYKRYRSTETAVLILLKVLSDIVYAIDTGNLSVLASLDLSAAFDTVDHGILLQRLETSFGFGGFVLDWFRSYLTEYNTLVEVHLARQRGRCVLDYHRDQCWVHSYIFNFYSSIRQN